MANPSSSATTVPAQKSTFVRRQIRLLGQPIRPSVAWTEHNAHVASVASTARGERRRRNDGTSLDPPEASQESRRTRRRVDGGEGGTQTGNDDINYINQAERVDGSNDREQQIIPSGGLPGDVVARILRQVNIRLKTHITHSYPSVATRHIAEQIDKLYWNAGAVIDEDAHIKALEFRERIRREEALFRPSNTHASNNGNGTDPWSQSIDYYDGFPGYDPVHEDDDDDTPFAPSDPRSTGLIGTQILPRVGDDFTLSRPFHTLPLTWNPSLDHTEPNTSAHMTKLAHEYSTLYSQLQSLHDRRVHLRLRAKAYTEMAKLLEPLVGEVGVVTQKEIDDRENELEAGSDNASLANIQSNLVARDSELQEELRVCRALSLQLRVRLAN